MKSKFTTIVIALAFVTASAFAINKLVTYKEFKSVALTATEGTETEDCQLKTKENNGGLVLFMKNDDKNVSFFVAKDAKIRKIGTEISDGSYSFDYTIADQGVLRVVHMDDAYFHVTLKSFRNNESANCDIDF